jgi:hypothetical protein
MNLDSCSTLGQAELLIVLFVIAGLENCSAVWEIDIYLDNRFRCTLLCLINVDFWESIRVYNSYTLPEGRTAPRGDESAST